MGSSSSLPQGEILLVLSPRRREDQAGTIPNVPLLTRRLARGRLLLLKRLGPKLQQSGYLIRRGAGATTTTDAKKSPAPECVGSGA